MALLKVCRAIEEAINDDEVNEFMAKIQFFGRQEDFVTAVDAPNPFDGHCFGPQGLAASGWAVELIRIGDANSQITVQMGFHPAPPLLEVLCL